MDVTTEILRKQIMVSQFVNAVGCTSEQATKILQSAQWHFEVQKVILAKKHYYRCKLGAPRLCVRVDLRNRN